MLHTVIFVGQSGSGKGTQADLFKNWIHRRDLEKRQILYVETGDRFRKFIRSEGYSSEVSKKLYDLDERQPDFLACWMWANVLIEELHPDTHLVFDGAARSLPEAQILTTSLKFYERERVTVVYINVSRKWSEEKLLSRGRFDDVNVDKIDKRLDWFEKDTKPAVDYFRNDPYYNFIEVNGEQTIEKVHKDIIDSYAD
jgi:adenylate kinase family enzyme